MIGQKHLTKTIQGMIQGNSFPRFCILLGEVGSGRRTLTKEIISSGLKTTFLEYDNKVDSVRDMILSSYKIQIPTLYFIADIDNMSVQAKNALLKITEEPPINAYFVMSAKSEGNILDTILSRAMILRMDEYSQDELALMYKGNAEDIMWCCNNMGDIQNILTYEIDKFKKFVNVAIDNIDTAPGANAMKMSTYLKLGDGDEGYNFEMFLRGFKNVCLSKVLDDINNIGEAQENIKYLKWIEITSHAERILKINGINQSSVFDKWLFDVRRAA